MIYLRGWHYAEGFAYVRAIQPSPIEVLSGNHDRPTLCQGFFHCFERRIRSALFVLSGRMSFQIEEERWDWLRDGVRVEHRQHWGLGLALRNTAFVYAAGKRRLSVNYVAPFPETDRSGSMAFDGIDEDTADWWLWLARVSDDPVRREALLKIWQAGI
jgi:hypothetical protein